MNLDLFCWMDELLMNGEEKQDVQIGFWNIPRECNRLADFYEKAAAKEAPIRH